jgi:hypothetical protein
VNNFFSFEFLVLILFVSKEGKAYCCYYRCRISSRHYFRSLASLGLRIRSYAEPFLAFTCFATMALFRRLLSESYRDAALHDVLLHLPNQIPDHMPCIDSFLVMLPSLPTYTVVCNIHIRQQFSMANGIVPNTLPAKFRILSLSFVIISKTLKLFGRTGT